MSTQRRVAITGVGLVSPLGKSPGEFLERLYQNESSIVSRPEWQLPPCCFATSLLSPVPDFDFSSIPRKARRTMSRVSGLAVAATEQAIHSSGLTPDLVKHERTGISYGSTMGGTSALRQYFETSISSQSMVGGVKSTTFPQIMSHTCAANIGIYFEVPGRVIASCTACAASTQALGFAYEAIKHNQLDRVLAGGAEELEPIVVAVFDGLGATARRSNDKPQTNPRPFAADRDGIVVGEGAGTLVLEEMSLAEARGAKIYGEIVGFYTNNDACHMTNPSVPGLVSAMQGALRDAGLTPDAISYVNAHGTGTTAGDQIESTAIHAVFGERMPVSSLKGHFGHLMGACGVIETIGCLGMLDDALIVGTRNSQQRDPQCAPLDYVSEGLRRDQKINYIMKNSFAFGGINACLVLAKV